MIGLGIMGSAMSGESDRAGYRVIGYDVLAKPRVESPPCGRERGARAAPRSREQADVIVCSLPSSDALLQTAAELAAVAAAASVVVETSTLPIAVKEEARRTLAERGATLLDCPLSGTGAQARAKDLVVYASGDRGRIAGSCRCWTRLRAPIITSARSAPARR